MFGPSVLMFGREEVRLDLPPQKDDKAQMLLATGVVLMMSLLSMAIFAIKLAGMSVPHDVASDAVIQTTQDVETVLPGLVEARAEVWFDNGVSALESVTKPWIPRMKIFSIMVKLVVLKSN